MSDKPHKLSPPHKVPQHAMTRPVKHYFIAPDRETTSQNCAQVESQTTVALELKVWCPSMARKGSTLCATGSLPQLGNWNIEKAPVAYSTKDSHIWKVEVFLPSLTSFEWAWAIKQSNSKLKPEVENCKRRVRTLNGFSGTLHSQWGEEEEVFLQSVTSVELTTFRIVDKGQCLVVSGSTPSTGNWLLKDAVKATEFPPMSGYWKAYITFDAQNVLSFKWIIVSEKKMDKAVVEEEDLHWLCGRAGWLQVVAPWNTTSTYVVGRELSEVSTGRTDLVLQEKKHREEEIREWQDSVLSCKTCETNKGPSPGDVINELISKLTVSDGKSTSNPRLSRHHAVSQTKRRPSLASRLSSFALTKPTKKGKIITPNQVQKLNDEGYSPSPGILLLKGKGQILPSQDLSLEDVPNQVPLLDVGHILRPGLVGSLKNDELVHKLPLGANQKSTLRTDFDYKSTNEYRQMSETPPVMDVLISNVQRATEMITRLETGGTKERDGIPVIEKDVSAVTAQLPTWSMMVEENIEQTLKLDIQEKPNNKIPNNKIPNNKIPNNEIPNNERPYKQTQIAEPQAPLRQRQGSPVPSISSLHRVTSLQIAGTARHPATVSSSISCISVSLSANEPSGVGHDDFFKTNADLIEERKNRKMWKQQRYEFQVKMEEQQKEVGKKDKQTMKQVTKTKRVVAKLHKSPTKVAIAKKASNVQDNKA